METCDRNGNCINDAPTYAQEQLADIERREAVDHPDYYVNRPRRAQDKRRLARLEKGGVVFEP